MRILSTAIILGLFLNSCVLPRAEVFDKPGAPIRGVEYAACMTTDGRILLDNKPGDGLFLLITHRTDSHIPFTRWGGRIFNDGPMKTNIEEQIWKAQDDYPGMSKATFNYLQLNGRNDLEGFAIQTGERSNFKPDMDLFNSGGRNDVGNLLIMKLQENGRAITHDIGHANVPGYAVFENTIKQNFVTLERHKIDDLGKWVEDFQDPDRSMRTREMPKASVITGSSK